MIFGVHPKKKERKGVQLIFSCVIYKKLRLFLENLFVYIIFVTFFLCFWIVFKKKEDS